MKSKLILIVIIAAMSQFANAGVGGPPGIFYEQFFDRGDVLKHDYRDVPGGAQAYEKYSDELKMKNEQKSIKNKIKVDNNVSQTTESYKSTY